MWKLLRKPTTLWGIASFIFAIFIGVGMELMGWEQTWGFPLGLAIIIVGALLAGTIASYAYILYKRQDVGISDEIRQERLKQIREPYATAITNTLHKMHRRSSYLMEEASRNRLTAKQLLDLYGDVAEILGFKDSQFRRILEKHKTADRTLFKPTHKIVYRRMKKVVNLKSLAGNKTTAFLINLSGAMENRKVGLIRLQDKDDEYQKLRSLLSEQRESITSKNCSFVIDNYIFFSYWLNSLMLLTSYSYPTAQKVLPAQVRARLEKPQQYYDRFMNLLLVDVASVIERWRLGEE